MNSLVMRAAGAVLLLVIGTAIGIWFTTNHFRPVLDEEQDRVSACTAARDNLEGLTKEQGKALGSLALAASERQAMAEQEVIQAKDSAQAEYVAANRLQQERTGGDQCAAATSIIDKELGL